MSVSTLAFTNLVTLPPISHFFLELGPRCNFRLFTKTQDKTTQCAYSYRTIRTRGGLFIIPPTPSLAGIPHGPKPLYQVMIKCPSQPGLKLKTEVVSRCMDRVVINCCLPDCPVAIVSHYLLTSNCLCQGPGECGWSTCYDHEDISPYCLLKVQSHLNNIYLTATIKIFAYIYI